MANESLSNRQVCIGCAGRSVAKSQPTRGPCLTPAHSRSIPWIRCRHAKSRSPTNRERTKARTAAQCSARVVRGLAVPSKRTSYGGSYCGSYTRDVHAASSLEDDAAATCQAKPLWLVIEGEHHLPPLLSRRYRYRRHAKEPCTAPPDEIHIHLYLLSSLCTRACL
jgi:hypothetical protein